MAEKSDIGDSVTVVVSDAAAAATAAAGSSATDGDAATETAEDVDADPVGDDVGGVDSSSSNVDRPSLNDEPMATSHLATGVGVSGDGAESPTTPSAECCDVDSGDELAPAALLKLSTVPADAAAAESDSGGDAGDAESTPADPLLLPADAASAVSVDGDSSSVPSANGTSGNGTVTPALSASAAAVTATAGKTVADSTPASAAATKTSSATKTVATAAPSAATATTATSNASSKTGSVKGGTAGGGSASGQITEEDYSPNHVVYKKMERLIYRMQAEHTGVQVRTVKSFMTKIPSVFTAEALHLAHLLAAHGYIFPIDDHILTVKNDNTFYRFQTPCFWPSMSIEPENTDYAVYLCKRAMQNKQRLELADYEAENLARLQKTFARKWEFVFMQAEAQAKVDKKREKLDRQILDSQERAFWDVHRPAPGCVNTTEADIKKTCRSTKQFKAFNKPNYSVFGGCITPCIIDASQQSISIEAEIKQLSKLLDRRRIKVSKVAESYMTYFEQYSEYDALITPPDCPNPWISDGTEFWEQEMTLRDIPQRRVKRWSFSIQELLKDSAGREHFMHFLEKEFSAENLKFWQSCQQLKQVPQKDVESTVQRIYSEYLAPGAIDPVNVDSRVADIVRRSIQQQIDRYCLDEAEDHIFKLMKNDSYSRYIRSDFYKEFLQGSKKKSKKRFTSEVRRFKDLTSSTKTPAAPQNSNET